MAFLQGKIAFFIETSFSLRAYDLIMMDAGVLRFVCLNGVSMISSLTSASSCGSRSSSVVQAVLFISHMVLLWLDGTSSLFSLYCLNYFFISWMQ